MTRIVRLRVTCDDDATLGHVTARGTRNMTPIILASSNFVTTIISTSSIPESDAGDILGVTNDAAHIVGVTLTFTLRILEFIQVHAGYRIQSIASYTRLKGMC